MYEKILYCPSCSNTDFSNESIIIDYAHSKESFALTRCNSCKLLFTNPRPSSHEIGKYYQFEEYQSHKSRRLSLFDLAYSLLRRYSIRRKRQLIFPYFNEGSILDFGSGNGNFLQSFSAKKWKRYGIEINDEARKYSNDTFGLNILENIDSIKPLPKFEVITCWHSLEHVHDLKHTIELLTSKLKSKGVLFIAVPNHKSYDAKYYGKYWAGFDVPRHLYHFHPRSLTRLFKQFKMSLSKTYPLYFDSYYVSLLSERYKGNSNSIINAIRIGYRSNHMAKSSNQYSSLIYVFRKK